MSLVCGVCDSMEAAGDGEGDVDGAGEVGGVGDPGSSSASMSFLKPGPTPGGAASNLCISIQAAVFSP